MKFKGSHSYLYNTVTGSTPIAIHGNGPIKVTDKLPPLTVPLNYEASFVRCSHPLPGPQTYAYRGHSHSGYWLSGHSHSGYWLSGDALQWGQISMWLLPCKCHLFSLSRKAAVVKFLANRGGLMKVGISVYGSLTNIECMLWGTKLCS